MHSGTSHLWPEGPLNVSYKYYPKEIITVFGHTTYVYTLHIFKAPDKERKLPTHHDAADGGLDDDDFSAV